MYLLPQAFKRYRTRMRTCETCKYNAATRTHTQAHDTSTTKTAQGNNTSTCNASKFTEYTTHTMYRMPKNKTVGSTSKYNKTMRDAKLYGNKHSAHKQCKPMNTEAN